MVSTELKEETKRCSKCDRELPRQKFSPYRWKCPAGMCKECESRYHKQRRRHIKKLQRYDRQYDTLDYLYDFEKVKELERKERNREQISVLEFIESGIPARNRFKRCEHFLMGEVVPRGLVVLRGSCWYIKPGKLKEIMELKNAISKSIKDYLSIKDIQVYFYYDKITQCVKIGETLRVDVWDRIKQLGHGMRGRLHENCELILILKGERDHKIHEDFRNLRHPKSEWFEFRDNNKLVQFVNEKKNEVVSTLA